VRSHFAWFNSSDWLAGMLLELFDVLRIIQRPEGSSASNIREHHDQWRRHEQHLCSGHRAKAQGCVASTKGNGTGARMSQYLYPVLKSICKPTSSNLDGQSCVLPVFRSDTVRGKVSSSPALPGLFVLASPTCLPWGPTPVVMMSV